MQGSNLPAVNPLNVLERADLRKAEATIETGLTSFVEVGNAMKAIQDGKLYRETHKTFEAYLEAKWNVSKSRAYQLIKAATVTENLSTTVDKPTTERAARALGKVEEERREEVMEAAAEETGGNVTAPAIERAAAKTSTTVDKKPKVVDAKKRPVPTDLVPAFEKAAEFKELARELTGFLKRAEALANGPAGAWLEYGSLRTDIENARSVIKFGTPYIVCTYCGGKGEGCKPCRGSGYLNQTTTTRNADE